MPATLLPLGRILSTLLLVCLPAAALAAIGTGRAPSDSVHYRS